MSKEVAIPDEVVMSKIYQIRGQKVMIDRDLAELYGVETKRLKEQVKRNIDIFPEHFMFELTEEEFSNLRSQFATSSWGGQRYLPYVFTELGVLQLANVVRSRRAKQMSRAEGDELKFDLNFGSEIAKNLRQKLCLTVFFVFAGKLG